MPDFDFIAPYYDSLASLVFGNTLRKVESHFFSYLKTKTRILVVGGGSGDIIESLAKVNPDLQVTYLEASGKMVQMAKEKFEGSIRKLKKPPVFIHGTEKDIPIDLKVDAICTPFVLDIYPQKEMEQMASKLDQHLNREGFWFFADFEPNKHTFWLARKILVPLMYQFFAWVSQIPARQTPNYEAFFAKHQFVQLESKRFFLNLIVSRLYQKAE